MARFKLDERAVEELLEGLPGCQDEVLENAAPGAALGVLGTPEQMMLATVAGALLHSNYLLAAVLLELRALRGERRDGEQADNGSSERGDAKCGSLRHY